MLDLWKFKEKENKGKGKTVQLFANGDKPFLRPNQPLYFGGKHIARQPLNFDGMHDRRRQLRARYQCKQAIRTGCGWHIRLGRRTDPNNNNQG